MFAKFRLAVKLGKCHRQWKKRCFIQFLSRDWVSTQQYHSSVSVWTHWGGSPLYQWYVCLPHSTSDHPASRKKQKGFGKWEYWVNGLVVRGVMTRAKICTVTAFQREKRGRERRCRLIETKCFIYFLPTYTREACVGTYKTENCPMLLLWLLLTVMPQKHLSGRTVIALVIDEINENNLSLWFVVNEIKQATTLV